MSRTALFSAAALVASALATPALCASVDLSPVIAAEPALTAQGNPVDLTPIASKKLSDKKNELKKNKQKHN